MRVGESIGPNIAEHATNDELILTQSQTHHMACDRAPARTIHGASCDEQSAFALGWQDAHEPARQTPGAAI